MSLLALLGGCGGVITDDGLTAGMFALGDTRRLRAARRRGLPGQRRRRRPRATRAAEDSARHPAAPARLRRPALLPRSRPTDLLPPEEGGCWFTGIGTFGKGDTRDSFGGNAMTMKDGRPRRVAARGPLRRHRPAQKNGQNLFHGKVHYIACKKFPRSAAPRSPRPYPNYANWGGTGRYNGVDGYFFDVKAFDHGEGGIHIDRYAIDIYDASKLVLHADGSVTEPTPRTRPARTMSR